MTAVLTRELRSIVKAKDENDSLTPNVLSISFLYTLNQKANPTNSP